MRRRAARAAGAHRGRAPRAALRSLGRDRRARHAEGGVPGRRGRSQHRRHQAARGVERHSLRREARCEPGCALRRDRAVRRLRARRRAALPGQREHRRGALDGGHRFRPDAPEGGGGSGADIQYPFHCHQGPHRARGHQVRVGGDARKSQDLHARLFSARSRRSASWGGTCATARDRHRHRSGQDPGRLGLRHRRRGHRRLRARQPPVRRPGNQGAAARGGRQGRLDLDPHPGRLPLLHRQPAHRLVLPDRARPGPERPLHPLCARQGAGRLLVDQRHALHARPGARLRRVGAAHRRCRAGRGRTCCRSSSKARTTSAGADEMHGAGGEWRVEPQRLSWEILEAFREAMAQAGIPKTDDFNRGDNEGCGYFLVNQKRGVRWSASKAFLRPVDEPAQPHRDHRRAGEPRAARGRTLHGGRVQPRRRGNVRRSAHRDGARRRRDRLAADAAALRHRSGALLRGSTASG